MLHFNLWLVLFLVAIAAAWFGTSKYRKTYDNQGEQMGGPYIIKFSNLDKQPDILTNQKIAETIQLPHKDSKGYRVYSKVNDEKLKKLIINELGLQENQVSVIYTKLFIPAFF